MNFPTPVPTHSSVPFCNSSAEVKEPHVLQIELIGVQIDAAGGLVASYTLNPQGEPVLVLSCKRLVIGTSILPTSLAEPPLCVQPPLQIPQEVPLPDLKADTWDRNPEELVLDDEDAPELPQTSMSPSEFWEMLEADIPGPFEREDFLCTVPIAPEEREWRRAGWDRETYTLVGDAFLAWIKPSEARTTAPCQQNWRKQPRLPQQKTDIILFNTLYGSSALVAIRDSDELALLLAHHEISLLPGPKKSTEFWNAGQVDCYLTLIASAIEEGVILPLE